MSADQIFHSDGITRISDALQGENFFLKSSRTSTLWLKYQMDMIDIYIGRAYWKIGIVTQIASASLIGSICTRTQPVNI